MPEHPREELLSAYGLDPSLVENAAELEQHLAGCASCRQHVAAIRSIEELLSDPASWTDAGEVAPVTAPRTLSGLAARNRREDAEAEALLQPLLDRFLAGSSGKFLWKDVAARPEYHTAGVVRTLADAADKAQYSVPLRALVLAEAASEIVERLSPVAYTSVEIAALRGVSWKQQANVNRQLGRFTAALDALALAEAAFRALPRPELDLASVSFIRGTIYFYQDAFELAAQHAEKSAATFSRLGQTELYLSSRHLQGCIAFEQREIGTAQAIFDVIYAYGEATGNQTWIARESQVLGHCYLVRGELARASQAFHLGMDAFRHLNMLLPETRCRWGIALVVQREGRYRTAVARLRDVREEFVNLGAVYDAALVTLDIMETFLLQEKPRDVQRTAGNIVELFKEAGVMTGAVTAADYLKRAAAMRKVTLGLVEYIRKYFRRVELQPDLAFVPPAAAL